MQSGLEGKRLWRHPWSDIDDVFERGVAALPERLFFELQEYNQAWHFSERHTVHYISAKVQKSQMNNLMYPLSPCIRSGSCCTTRLCRPCCGSGWRPGTFINRWPRSLRRAKMVTRLRPLNSPCWGKHKCPRNPSQPWLLLEKYIKSSVCVHMCFCAWVCVTSIFDLSCTVTAACCVCIFRGQGLVHCTIICFLILFFSSVHGLTETVRCK